MKRLNETISKMKDGDVIYEHLYWNKTFKGTVGMLKDGEKVYLTYALIHPNDFKDKEMRLGISKEGGRERVYNRLKYAKYKKSVVYCVTASRIAPTTSLRELLLRRATARGRFSRKSHALTAILSRVETKFEMHRRMK